MAAAADMSAALPELVAAYTKKTGQTVKLSFGSSGNLTNQIKKRRALRCLLLGRRRISPAADR